MRKILVALILLSTGLELMLGTQATTVMACDSAPSFEAQAATTAEVVVASAEIEDEPSTLDALKELGGDLAEKAKEKGSELIEKAKEKAPAVKEKISEKASDAKEKLTDARDDFVEWNQRQQQEVVDRVNQQTGQTSAADDSAPADSDASEQDASSEDAATDQRRPERSDHSTSEATDSSASERTGKESNADSETLAPDPSDARNAMSSAVETASDEVAAEEDDSGWSDWQIILTWAAVTILIVVTLLTALLKRPG